MKIFKYLVNIRFILPNEKDNTLTPFIAPSILSADFARLGEEVNAVLDAGADIIHFDVMDNRFVPNLTIGPLVCQSLRDFGVKAPIDVHLMAEPVDNLILDFSKAGASYISFHPEASRHVHRSLNLIREKGCKAGLVFSPATPLTWLEHLIDDLDLILIMSVNPGFGGQSFIESSLDKINKVRKIIDSSGNNIRLEVDGGVKIQNIKEIATAGADTFVAGSAIFNSNNYSETISAMKAEIQLAGPLILKDTDN
jgi:ribulose-phosphate 3-epimerase